MENETQQKRLNTDFKRRLKDICLKNKEGFSIDFNLKPNTYKTGFFVSITDNKNKNLDLAIKNLFKTKRNKFKHFSHKKLYIGFWIDKKTNISYLDLSLYIKSQKYALLIGKLFNQKAIFNISNFQEIRIN